MARFCHLWLLRNVSPCQISIEIAVDLKHVIDIFLLKVDQRYFRFSEQLVKSDVGQLCAFPQLGDPDLELADRLLRFVLLHDLIFDVNLGQLLPDLQRNFIHVLLPTREELDLVEFVA